MDYLHASFPTEIPASWPLSSKNSVASYPSIIMPVRHIDPKLMDNQNGLTKNRNNIPKCLPTSIKTVGAAYYHWPNATTKKAPFELIMGHIPRVHQSFRITSSPPLNDCLTLISQARKDTTEAMRRSQALEVPSNFILYNIGDCVWLEAKNLNTTHPSAKLAP
jgi:hypothetical protein